jgi:hypothetical protein
MSPQDLTCSLAGHLFLGMNTPIVGTADMGQSLDFNIISLRRAMLGFAKEKL